MSLNIRESSVGRNFEKVVVGLGVMATLAGCATESTKEIKTDRKFVGSLLAEYLHSDANPQLQKLQDPEYLGAVLEKFLPGDMPTDSKKVQSGNFNPKEKATYRVDGIWITNAGNEATIAFTIDEDGNIPPFGDPLKAKTPWDTIGQGNSATAQTLTRLVVHKPEGWKITGGIAGPVRGEAMKSEVSLPDGKKIEYEIKNNDESNLPYVLMTISTLSSPSSPVQVFNCDGAKEYEARLATATAAATKLRAVDPAKFDEISATATVEAFAQRERDDKRFAISRAEGDAQPQRIKDRKIYSDIFRTPVPGETNSEKSNRYDVAMAEGAAQREIDRGMEIGRNAIISATATVEASVQKARDSGRFDEIRSTATAAAQTATPQAKNQPSVPSKATC